MLEWLQLLDDAWLVLHSFGILNHPFKAWAEIDVLVIGPTGLMCLEVKGGRILRRSGLWGFQDRQGNVTWKREGPFDQVGQAHAALRRQLIESGHFATDTVSGYGVLFPDVAIEDDGPGVIEQIMLDTSGDWSNPTRLVKEWCSYWGDRTGNHSGLDEEQVELLIAALQPEIDLAPSLSLLANDVVESLTRLTEEQIRVMSAASVNPRLIVTGRAGTGKTMLAQHETRRLADEVSRVLLVYPNPNLALRSREVLNSRDRVTVATFQQLEDGVSGDPFDSVVIDEAQDLPERLLSTLDRMLKGGLQGGTWRIFLDPAQSVLGEVAPMDTRLDNAAARLHLSLNCRNTRQIAVFTSMLTRMDLDLDAPAEGPDVTQLWFNDDGQHDELLRQELVRLAEDLGPERVAILSEQRPTAEELDALSASSGIRVRLISDSDPGAVTASSVDDFQGLESDAVIVTNLRGLDTVADRRLAYVACTRARVQLSVLMNDDLRSSYQDGALWFGRRLTARGGRNQAG